jgi:aconitase A
MVRPPRTPIRRRLLQRKYSLGKASAQLGDASHLPFSTKVLLENLLRFEDGPAVTGA